ncbi:MAG: GntR family transcriptional regulator [Acidobacteriota bacterium]
MSTLRLRIDPRSATPIYDQLVRQVKSAVAAGTLPVGAALPSVRQLAVELRINPNTVARAYRELESDGVVEARRGQGTFVAGEGRPLTAAGRRKEIAPLVEQLVAEARLLGFESEELVELVRKTASRRSGRSKEEDAS